MGDTPLNPISSLPTTNYLRTQFQIESGGMVQINLDFFSSCDLKLKLCQLSIQKNRVDFSFSGSDKFFKKEWKKSNTLQKNFFFSKNKQQKIYKVFLQHFFYFYLKGLQKNLFMIYNQYWLVVFLDHTNISNFY